MPETRHLEVLEQDLFPDVLPVHKIFVPSGTEVDNSDGSIDLNYAGAAVGSFTEGAVPFGNASGLLTEDAPDFTYDPVADELVVSNITMDEILDTTGFLQLRDGSGNICTYDFTTIVGPQIISLSSFSITEQEFHLLRLGASFEDLRLTAPSANTLNYTTTTGVKLIDFIAMGLEISIIEANGFTTEDALNINVATELLTSGELLDINLTSTNTDTAKTGNVVSITSSRGVGDLASLTETFDLLTLQRNTNESLAGSISNGSILNIINSNIPGSILGTDNVIAIEILMESHSSGAAIKIDQDGSGAAINIDGDNTGIQLGEEQDSLLDFTGLGLLVRSDVVTSTDHLQLRGGTNGINFNIGATEEMTLTATQLDLKSNDFVTTGDVSADDLTLTGNINLVTSTSTAGNIVQNSLTVFHSFGTANIFVGERSGNFTLSTASSNVAVGGNRCLDALTTGSSNVALGALAGTNVTSGNNNFALGTFALTNDVTGQRNVAIGTSALSNTLGTGSVGIGYIALVNATGNENIGIGENSGGNMTSGNENVFIGDNAGVGIGAHSKSGNVFIGNRAGQDENGSNLLYIHNVASATPLIKGDFSGLTLTFNADITIGVGAVGKDYTLTFDGQNNDGVFLWDEGNDWFQSNDKWLFDLEVEIDGDLNHDGSNIGFYGTAPAAQSAAYTRNATIVESRTLLASASATILNNNNVLAALIADLQSIGLLG